MRVLFLPALALIAAPAVAADLTVEVRAPNGAPVRNAVVSLYPNGQAARPAAPAAPFRIVQKDLAFSPFVLIVPVGSQVAFPNLDNVRHHVYSFSPAKKFELKLYAREQNRTVRFDKAGAVPLGCNIHDSMAAFIKVSDTAFAVRTDASGRASFANLPPGTVVARVWHPYLRAPGNQLELRWNLPRTGRSTQAVALNLRPPPRHNRTY